MRIRIEPVDRASPRSCRHRSCRCGRSWPMRSSTLSTSVESTSTSIFTFGHELDLVLVASERLGLAALAAVALDLADGEAEDAGAPQRFLHLLELERFDDCGHEMSHAVLLAECDADTVESVESSEREVGSDADPTSRSGSSRSDGLILRCRRSTGDGPSGGRRSGRSRVAHAVAELHVVGGRAVLDDVETFELAVLARAAGSRSPGSA